MSDSSSSDSEDSTYQPITANSSNSNSNATAPAVAPPSPPICGCAYLQAILGQIRSGVYSTTTGDYLETIFTHREALYAFPQGHRACAVGFSELAGHLARRERQVGYRPDWEGDSDAVNAFRNEAWVIANTL
ncbi:hypothetical protein OH76DRAFT_1403918 [Lentinus brumalis]|uniref:Uncharacterized protein n=1 Tax=Lentinus brumalis TaxID=2498619 RepID=A0A371D9Y0_9APHY|nr:hypothetical protein OH76DRAFT_1403918 [Polyporus brumalis]